MAVIQTVGVAVGGSVSRRGMPVLRKSVGIVAALVLWQLVYVLRILPHEYFPSLGATVRSLFTALGENATWQAIGATIRGWLVGCLIAACLAIPIGFLVGLVGTLYQSIRVLIEFMRPIPPVALVPAVVIIFSSAFQMEIALVAFGAFWPLFFQAMYGVRDTDPVTRDTARIYGLSRGAVLRNVVLLSALPYVATGLRIAASIGLILAVTAELVIGIPGIGRSLTDAQSGGDVALMYATVLLTGVIGVIVNTALSAFERRLLWWHVSKRGVVQ